MTSLKIKQQYKIEQVQTEYWETDIWKVNEFNFLNEEVEKFSNRWSPNLLNVRTLATWSKKPFNIAYEA